MPAPLKPQLRAQVTRAPQPPAPQLPAPEATVAWREGRCADGSVVVVLPWALEQTPQHLRAFEVVLIHYTLRGETVTAAQFSDTPAGIEHLIPSELTAHYRALVDAFRPLLDRRPLTPADILQLTAEVASQTPLDAGLTTDHVALD